MAKIHIDAKKGSRATKEEVWPVQKLRLDPQNVRFRHIDTVINDAEIEKLIWEESDTKDLYRAIIASGGLSEKPFITADGIVKEGNRRIVCLRKGKAELKAGKLPAIAPGTFDNVEVEVFEEQLTPAEMDIWLARVHVTGKKQWGALNQADHLFRLYHDRGYSYEDIRQYLGMGKAEVIRKIQAYQATREYLREMKERDITQYSFFEEIYKRRPLASLFDGDPEFRRKVLQWIHARKFNATGAKDMRFLLDVLKDKDAKRAFEDTDMRAALFEMQRKNPALASPVFRSVEATLDALKGMSRDELKALSNDVRRIELLRQLRAEVEQVLHDAKGKAVSNR